MIKKSLFIQWIVVELHKISYYKLLFEYCIYHWMYILQINSDKMIGCHQRQIKEFMKSQIIPIALGNRKRKRAISTCQNRNRRLGCRQISALSSRMRFHDVRKIVGKIWIRFRRSRGSRRGNRGWFRPRVSQLVWTSLESETTIYSDSLTKHHPPFLMHLLIKNIFAALHKWFN